LNLKEKLQVRKNRYPELDCLRGIAIVMMVIFHFVFDLSFFSLYPVTVDSGLWRFFGYLTAVLFVMIAGTAVAIRSGRNPVQDSWFRIAIPYFRRGLFLVGIGMGITLITWVYLQGSGYVLFGILHLIGTATILAPVFFRFRAALIFPGIVLILAGWFILLPDGPLWLAWVGIHPIDFYSVDYTPLIPWLGYYLLGMGIGYHLYPGGVRKYPLPARIERMCRYPAIPGRHSLIIYLVHQPILIGILLGISGYGWR